MLQYFKTELIKTLKFWGIFLLFAMLVPFVLMIGDYFYRLIP